MPTTRYVFTSTSATGYSSAPTEARYITIASAITAAVDGDTINIAAGEYKENVAVNKSLTISGAQANTPAYSGDGVQRSGSETIIAGHASNGGNCFTITANNVTVNGVKCVLPANGGSQTATIRDAFNIQGPNNAVVGSQVTRNNITIQNNIIISNAITSQRQSLVLGESMANAVQTGKAKLLDIIFSGNFIDFSVTTNSSCRGIIFNSQYADIKFENVEISNNYIKHTSSSANTPLGSYYGSAITRPLYYVGLKITGNTINAPNSTGIRGLFDMNGTSIISGNTIVAKTGMWVNFNEAGGQIINNTVTTSNLAAANGGVAIYIADGAYSTTNGFTATITGNTLTDTSGYNNRYMQLDISGFDIASLVSSNTFTRLPFTSSVASSPPFLKNGQIITTTPIVLFSTFATALAAVSAGATIELAAGSYSGGQLAINKGVSVKGAGMALTTYTDSTGTAESVVLNKAGAALRDIKILKPHTNTYSVISVQRESSAVDAAGCSLINVQVGSSTATALDRGVDINGVSSVTVTGCTFAQTTASYSLGLYSVKGATISGCVIPSDKVLYGGVGIFASTSASVTDSSSSGIDLSAAWADTSYAGMVNIQPSAYATYKLAGASGSAVVTLPASFVHSYLMQKRTSAGVDVGDEIVSISNDKSLEDEGMYNALQSAAEPDHYALFGRNLTSSQIFYDATFYNEENNAYGGAGAAGSITTGLVSALAAPLATAGDVAAAAAAASVSAFGSVDRTDLNSAQVEIRLLPVIEGLLAAADTAAAAAAPGSAAANVADDTTLSLVEEANTEYLENDTIAGKAVIAAAIENRPNISLSVAQATSFLSKLKPEDVSEELDGKEIILTPAKSLVADGETIRYILRNPSPYATYEHTPMIPDEWYNLLLDTEVDEEGVPNPPTDAVISQLKYAKDVADNKYKIYWRPTSDDAPTEKTLGQYYYIVRPSVESPFSITYRFKLCAIGSLNTKAELALFCIPAGQRILTGSGWRAVEDIHTGDMVVTDAGVSVPAKIYSTTVTTTSKTAPINIPAKLFGKKGDAIRLSPNHAVRMDKSIWQFPCNLLQLHPGVTQDAPGQKVTYYHIALPNYLRDNLVLEGGVVAESFGIPFVKANNLQHVKFYTFNMRLGGFTRMSYGAMANKSKTA